MPAAGPGQSRDDHAVRRQRRAQARCSCLPPSLLGDVMGSCLPMWLPASSRRRCAETCYWRCHRKLISDALQVRGVRVLHLMQAGKQPLPHKLTQFARVEGQRITYPPYAGHGLAPAARRQAEGKQGAQQPEGAAKRGIGKFFTTMTPEQEREQEQGQGQQAMQHEPAARQERGGAGAAASTARKRGIGRYFTRLAAQEAEKQAERESLQVAGGAAPGAAAGTGGRKRGIAAFFPAAPSAKRRKSVEKVSG